MGYVGFSAAFSISVAALALGNNEKIPWFNYMKSFSQRLIYLLLCPIVTVISIAIASSLSLSIGMIGALSIVRFRYPVKYAAELVLYFALIANASSVLQKNYIIT